MYYWNHTANSEYVINRYDKRKINVIQMDAILHRGRSIYTYEA